MGGLVFKAIAKKGEDKLPKNQHSSLLDYNFKPLLPEGAEETTIKDLCADKKVILCVNVATK